MTELLELAENAGFEHYGALDPKTIVPEPKVRQMCAENLCGKYGKCWSCPPACGTLEQLRLQLEGCRRGILVQSTARLEDAFDAETMMQTQLLHQERFEKLHGVLREKYPHVLAMGAGCCTKCESCTCPDAPCRFPEQMTSSMEAYGLVVSQVCKANNMGYNYGENTITFTSCFLLRGEDYE